MLLNAENFEEFETCAYELKQLSFLYRVLLTADLSATEWNSGVFYDVLYSFSAKLSEISDMLNQLQTRFESESKKNG